MQVVILVQHSQAYHHVLPEAKLWPDIRNGLTSKGQRQAQCAATRLRQEVAGRPCQVYTSAMRRATETAEILARELRVTAQPVPDLHEFNGRFAMERTGNSEEWTIDNSNWSLFDWRPFPEAETWREFHTRVAAAMDRLAGTCSDTTLPILVVAEVASCRPATDMAAPSAISSSGGSAFPWMRCLSAPALRHRPEVCPYLREIDTGSLLSRG